MNSSVRNPTHFTDRRISTERAIAILAKNDIQVNHKEAALILDFFYHIAQCYRKGETCKSLSENRTNEKVS